MLNIAIVGASGYSGAELVNYMHRHMFSKIKKLFVSENSLNVGKKFSELYPEFTNIINLSFEDIISSNSIGEDIDAVFLATDHNISHNLVPFFFIS